MKRSLHGSAIASLREKKEKKVLEGFLYEIKVNTMRIMWTLGGTGSIFYLALLLNCPDKILGIVFFGKRTQLTGIFWKTDPIKPGIL